MPTPATPSWHQQAETVHTQIEALCAALADAPIAERLATLHLLQESFHAVHDDALTAAATAARDAGWGLRRIGTAIGRSHEQVRKMTAAPTRAPLTPAPGNIAALTG